MSDSDLSEPSSAPIPSDNELENSLRREVTDAQRAGKEYSYNSIRAASEINLGLETRFYKNHKIWNKKSKEIIDSQVVTMSSSCRMLMAN
jgi:hypothetical protein